jgi:transcriptional regulator with XRE-family HTH domain
MSIRKQLEQAIIDARIEQHELAASSGVARSTLWYLSAGKRGGSVDTADKIAEGLGMEWRLVKKEDT